MRFLLLPLLRRARSLVPEPYLPYTPLLLRATPSLRRLPRVYATRLIYRVRPSRYFVLYIVFALFLLSLPFLSAICSLLSFLFFISWLFIFTHFIII
ncbi:hypothetical protein E2C01_082221 [Portunus trituberculatus]|uniref:Uncharacterized protein n=1 Tax=Portunus trituberculatus TaxID=210409 RepID=A0A5B7IRT5_PORTR|nr:hypothetical protein [Portunus trituberculatus]